MIKLLTLANSILNAVREHILLVNVGKVAGLLQKSFGEGIIKRRVVSILNVEVVVDLGLSKPQMKLNYGRFLSLTFHLRSSQNTQSTLERMPQTMFWKLLFIPLR